MKEGLKFSTFLKKSLSLFTFIIRHQFKSVACTAVATGGKSSDSMHQPTNHVGDVYKELTLGNPGYQSLDN